MWRDGKIFYILSKKYTGGVVETTKLIGKGYYWVRLKQTS